MINHEIPASGAAFTGYYETPRLGLLDLVEGAVHRVLEIGCGGGVNLAELARRHPGCQTTGVEIREDAAHAAREARRAHTLLVGNVLDTQQVPLPPAGYDLIVLSHVLEHFAQPEQVLALCRRSLAGGGQLLVALPNVRHVSVLVDLAWRGDFPYRSAGILDRTHLRFYTRKSASRFFAECGWRVAACRADINGPKSRRLSRGTLGLADDFAAFAYNFRLLAE